MSAQSSDGADERAAVKNDRKKWRAGVLGATGLVGQRLVKLLRTLLGPDLRGSRSVAPRIANP